MGRHLEEIFKVIKMHQVVFRLKGEGETGTIIGMQNKANGLIPRYNGKIPGPALHYSIIQLVLQGCWPYALGYLVIILSFTFSPPLPS